MAEDKLKVFKPETIEDNPLPEQQATGETFESSSDGSATKEVHKPKSIREQFIDKKIAFEVLSSALNTKARKILGKFTFTKSGSLQIGEYTNGVSGDLKLTPNGLTARDSAGATTFSIDGSTGNAAFKGSLQSGSVITGDVVVGDNSIVLDGTNKQIIVNGGKIIIKDQDEVTIIDEYGLVSGANFVFGSDYSESLYTITNSTSDFGSLVQTFSLPRAARVLMMATASVSTQWSTGNSDVANIRINIDNTDTKPYGVINGFRASNPVGIYTSVNTHIVKELAAGSHTIKLRLTHSGNATGSDIVERQLTYLVLGK